MYKKMVDKNISHRMRTKRGHRGGRCAECERTTSELIYYQRRYICGECLTGPFEPIDIEQRVWTNSAIGRCAEIHGYLQSEYDRLEYVRRERRRKRERCAEWWRENRGKDSDYYKSKKNNTA